MKLIALTGGIGCGKSTVSSFFRNSGRWLVIDADACVHELYSRATPEFLIPFQNRWGKKIIGNDGVIDRNELAKIVFSSDEERRALNEMVHPQVIALMKTKIAASAGTAAVMLDVPLYFECSGMPEAEKVVAVWAAPELQKRRLRLRSSWPDAEIKRRIDAQLSADEKLRRADYGLINNGSEEFLFRQCVLLSEQLGVPL